VKLKALTLNDDQLPESVTVEMTAKEALYLTLLLGSQSPLEGEKHLTGGGNLGSGIYNVLSGDLFNRFYDDGEAEARDSGA
jgi:hypothetical protein